MRLSFHEHVQDKPVIDARGAALGEIEGLIVDSDGWKVVGFTVKLRRGVNEELGVSRHLFSLARPVVEIPTDLVQSVGDAVILRVTAADMRAGTATHPQPSAP